MSGGLSRPIICHKSSCCFTIASFCQSLHRTIMTIQLKSADDIVKMRVAGKLAAEVLEMIGPHVQAGVSTGELDRICHQHIVEQQQAIPAPLNYNGFPKSICTSVNQVICHGIPSDSKILKSGDIINIDVTVIKDEFHGDSSKMFAIGEVPAHAQRLIRITQECLYKAIDLVKPGIPWAISAMSSSNTARPTTTLSCGSIAATASAGYSTRNHRCCITASPIPAPASKQA